MVCLIPASCFQRDQVWMLQNLLCDWQYKAIHVTNTLWNNSLYTWKQITKHLQSSLWDNAIMSIHYHHITNLPSLLWTTSTYSMESKSSTSLFLAVVYDAVFFYLAFINCSSNYFNPCSLFPLYSQKNWVEGFISTVFIKSKRKGESWAAEALMCQ